MKKKIVSLILVLLIIFSVPVGAYQLTGYELHSDAAMLVSMDTGDILFEKNSTAKMYPASITKLMTAIIMIENIPDLDGTYITYSKEARNKILGTGSAVFGLIVGEKISAKDALASLLISSHGDTAYAIAEHIGGTIDGFVTMMNDKAKALGLNNTHYTNPVGLHDDDLYTTAQDIYILAKKAFEYEIIKEFASKATYKTTATNHHSSRTLTTSNMMINPNTNVYYQYAICGKTGFTDEAGRCLVSLASYRGYTYMAIVLKSKTIRGVRNEFIDSANMYRWAFNNFEYKTILNDTTPVTEVPVELSSETDFVSLNLENSLQALLPVEADMSTVIIDTHPSAEKFDAPIKKGQVLGTADIYYAEEKIGTVNLVASNDINASSLLIFARSAKLFLTSTLMKTVYLIIGLAVLIFIIITIRLNITKKKRRRVRYVPMNKKDYKD